MAKKKPEEEAVEDVEKFADKLLDEDEDDEFTETWEDEDDEDDDPLGIWGDDDDDIDEALE